MEKNQYALRMAGLLTEEEVAIDMQPWSKMFDQILAGIKEDINAQLADMKPSRAQLLSKELLRVKERIPLYGSRR